MKEGFKRPVHTLLKVCSIDLVVKSPISEIYFAERVRQEHVHDRRHSRPVGAKPQCEGKFQPRGNANGGPLCRCQPREAYERRTEVRTSNCTARQVRCQYFFVDRIRAKGGLVLRIFIMKKGQVITFNTFLERRCQRLFLSPRTCAWSPASAMSFSSRRSSSRIPS